MKKKTESSVKSTVLTGVSASVGAIGGNLVASVVDEPVVELIEGFIEDSEDKSDEEVLDEFFADLQEELHEGSAVVLDEGVLAVVDVDGVQYAVTDSDGDGYADFLGTDNNGNGIFDYDEIYDISDDNIEMPTSQDPCGEDDFLLSCENDYINDANVDDYIA